ncbi:regulatory Fis family protein [Edaphobacter aggregans]|uniref:Regulatory Fis family protein n=1 Tax=Edaphobacter aggregans TaxID=570835 RepID=A0A428MCR5_9BACT|nr:sigma 54-interacting transcriptional regulator [Edaphobacter aggregans]RSL14617.1 regulatory Fis family protein [Edaphobacter aggregans]
MERELSDAALQSLFGDLGFVSNCDELLPLLQRARKAAEISDVTVLIEGETGTGKQVLAQAIHRLDRKRNRFAFITVHCSTITEALAESELFGHQRGAFSGAVGSRKGLFCSAQHGTLFLDDVNDLPVALQPKLLDVLQRGILRPVGSDTEMPVDVRIIAAANRPLESLVREGRFRLDLYHRLNVVRLALPPLRARRADLTALILAFADRHAALYAPVVNVESELLRFLESQPLLGNVRELENAVQRMLFLKTEGSSLCIDDWMRQLRSDVTQQEVDLLADSASGVWQSIANGSLGYDQALQEIEKRVLQAAIAVPGWTRRKVAQRLHMSERALYYKMRACGLTAR